MSAVYSLFLKYSRAFERFAPCSANTLEFLAFCSSNALVPFDRFAPCFSCTSVSCERFAPRVSIAAVPFERLASCFSNALVHFERFSPGLEILESFSRFNPFRDVHSLFLKVSSSFRAVCSSLLTYSSPFRTFAPGFSNSRGLVRVSPIL